MRIEGIGALVTGASRGIGAALVRELARGKVRSLVINARSAEALGTVADDVRERGVSVASIVGSVADPDTADRLAAAARELGSLDLVVNNAAILLEPSPFETIAPEAWGRILSINVMGTIHVARATLPLLRQAPTGCLLNLSSTWGRVGAPEVSAYCTSKFAVEGLSQSIAHEERGLIVCAVNPGVVATEMLAMAFGGDVSSYTPPDRCAREFVSLIGRLSTADSGQPQTV